MNTRFANEVRRLKAAELETERLYGEAVKESDLSAARNAAAEWRKAAAALTQYVTKHPRSRRGSG
jgi:hypothetical protein